MPYYKWVMLFGLWTVIAVQMNDLLYQQTALNNSHKYNLVIDITMIII